jgi:hypothetical protein
MLPTTSPVTVHAQVTLESSGHIEGIAEPGSIKGPGCGVGPSTGSAEKENGLIGLETVGCVDQEVGVRLATGKRRPLDEAWGTSELLERRNSHEGPFRRRSNVDQYGSVVGFQHGPSVDERELSNHGTTFRRRDRFPTK